MAKHFTQGTVRPREDCKRPWFQGLWRVYQEGGPKPKWKTIHLGFVDEIDKKEAKRRLQKLLSEEQSNVVNTQKGITLNDYLDSHYVNGFLPGCEPSMQKSYRQIIMKHIRPEFGATALEAVTRKDVQRYINQLAAQGRAKQTMQNVRNVLRSICREAIRDERVAHNPCTYINMPDT